MSYPTPILQRMVYRYGCDPGSHFQRHTRGQRWKGHDKLHRHFCRALAMNNSLEPAWACFGTPQPCLRIPEEVSDSQFLRRTINSKSWVGGWRHLQSLLDPLWGVLLSLLRFPSQTMHAGCSGGYLKCWKHTHAPHLWSSGLFFFLK